MGQYLCHFFLWANLQDKTQVGKTPLILAIQQHHVAIVRLLIKHGAYVKKTEDDLFSPIHAAIDQGQNNIVKLLLKKDNSIVEEIHSDLLPLINAIIFEKVSLLKLLIEYGAKLEKKGTPNGLTPLMFACQEKRIINDIEIARVLIDSYPKTLLQKNNENEYPLTIAVKAGKKSMVSFLIENYSHILNFEMIKQANLKCKLKQIKEILPVEKYHPLMAAIKNDDCEMVKHLIKNGIDVNMKNEKNETPLTVALRNCNPEIILLLINAMRAKIVFLKNMKNILLELSKSNPNFTNFD